MIAFFASFGSLLQSCASAVSEMWLDLGDHHLHLIHGQFMFLLYQKLFLFHDSIILCHMDTNANIDQRQRCRQIKCG